MKVTFTIKDKTVAFFEGNSAVYPAGHVMRVVGLNELPTNAAKFERLNNLAVDKLGVSIRVGLSNAFRDRVELNQLIRDGVEPSFKLENRRGYKLATFIFAK